METTAKSTRTSSGYLWDWYRNGDFAGSTTSRPERVYFPGFAKQYALAYNHSVIAVVSLHEQPDPGILGGCSPYAMNLAQ